MIYKSDRALLALFLSLSIFSLTGCESDEQKANNYLISANVYFQKNEFKLATVELKNAIKNDSGLIEAYLLQSKIYEKQRNFEAMSAFLASALQQQSNHIEANIESAKLLAKGGEIKLAQNHLDTAITSGAIDYDRNIVQGLIYLQTKEFDQALNEVQLALDSDPQSAEGGIIKSLIFLSTKQYGRALSTVNIAKQFNSKNEHVLSLKTKIHTMQGDFEEAIQQAGELYNLFPKQLSHYYLQATLYEQTGNTEGAEQALRKAITANPSNTKAKIALAGYISERDSKQRAILLLSSFIDANKNQGNYELQLLLAELHEQQGDNKTAQRIYLELTKQSNQDSTTPKNKLALIALKEKDVTKALTILDEILQSEFNNTQALITRGLVYLSNQQADEAINDLLLALRENPDSELALLLLSRAYHQTKNYEQAAHHLKQLLKINASNQEAVTLYSQILHQQNKYIDSIAPLATFLNQNTSSPIQSQLLINAYLATENWAQAKNLAPIIANDLNQPLYTQYIDAYILEKMQHHAESLQAYKSLFQKDVFISLSLKSIIFNYHALKKPIEAIQYLEHYLSTKPDDLFVISLLASEHEYQNNRAMAIKLLEKHSTRNTLWGRGHLQLAKLYAAQKNWSKATSSALNALNDTNLSSSVELMLILASSYEQINDTKNAIQYYQSALQIAPTMDAAANNLALLLAEDDSIDGNLVLALESAERFKESTHPFYLDTLGWIYSLNGKYQLAAALLEKAVFSAPDEAIIHYHLGATHFKLSENADALQHLQRSLSLSKNNSEFEYYNEVNTLIDLIPNKFKIADKP
jgi:tetratricopeptide (TPR) repeat protein